MESKLEKGKKKKKNSKILIKKDGIEEGRRYIIGD